MARPRGQLIERTSISLKLKLLASSLSGSIQATEAYATTARIKKHQRLSGNGRQLLRSGIDGPFITRTGCTGVHQRVDSPQVDGLGIKVSGIMVASSINTMTATGGDSRTEDGSDITSKFPSHHPTQEAGKSAESSTKE